MLYLVVAWDRSHSTWNRHKIRLRRTHGRYGCPWLYTPLFDVPPGTIPSRALYHDIYIPVSKATNF